MCWMKVLLDTGHANASMDDIQVRIFFSLLINEKYVLCQLMLLCKCSMIFQKDLSPLVKQLAPGNDNEAQIPYVTCSIYFFVWIFRDLIFTEFLLLYIINFCIIANSLVLINIHFVDPLVSTVFWVKRRFG